MISVESVRLTITLNQSFSFSSIYPSACLSVIFTFCALKKSCNVPNVLAVKDASIDVLGKDGAADRDNDQAHMAKDASLICLSDDEDDNDSVDEDGNRAMKIPFSRKPATDTMGKVVLALPGRVKGKAA